MTSLGQREHAVDLDIWGWILLLFRVIGITFALLLKAVKALPSSGKCRLSFYEFMTRLGMRDYQYHLHAIEIQNLLPSTSKTCTRYARRHGLACSTVVLPDGTTAFRLGPQQSAKVVVLFHGGGYMAPALPQHIELAFGFASPSERNAAVFVLQYDLASEEANHYPQQLKQAVSLMQHLLVSEKISPPAITLIGDSAGAHLLLGLLFHLVHPKPDLPSVGFEGHFAGAAFISPWTVLEPQSESVQNAACNDIVEKEALAYWARNFLGGAALDPWNDPLSAPEEWWGDLPVDDLLVTYGKCELLRDDSSRLSGVLQKFHPCTKVLECSGEIHIHMLVNRLLRINKPCQSESMFAQWLSNQMSASWTLGNNNLQLQREAV